jgi:hypothetical protein
LNHWHYQLAWKPPGIDTGHGGVVPAVEPPTLPGSPALNLDLVVEKK